MRGPPAQPRRERAERAPIEGRAPSAQEVTRPHIDLPSRNGSSLTCAATTTHSSRTGATSCLGVAVGRVHRALSGISPQTEWQAQDTKSLWHTVMHFRPSGIRAKRPTYLPALVAITQTSIVGPRERRLSPRETARLQGLPDTFVFPDQPASATYKQMGNGVAIGAVQHVFREHVLRDAAAEILDGYAADGVTAAEAPYDPGRHREAHCGGGRRSTTPGAKVKGSWTPTCPRASRGPSLPSPGILHAVGSIRRILI